MFGYKQCDIEVPEDLKKKFANFPPVFKNTNVGRHDIGLLIKAYAEKEGLLCQPRKMLTSSYFFENGTLVTSLLLVYKDLGLVCKKIYRFVEYIPVKSFNKYVQSALSARRVGDENPSSNVVAETMKLLAKSSYGYQIMDRSRHAVIKCLSDEKTNGAINTKLFKRLDYINDQLYAVEFANAEMRLSTENQSLLGFSFSNTLNLESWSFTTTFREILWRQQIWEVKSGHWFFVFGSVWKKVVRLHSRRIWSWMGNNENRRLQRWFHS